MNEDALRALVREAVSRRLSSTVEPGAATEQAQPLAHRVSHFRYVLPKTDGPCLIEPTVQCNHCGYCESHGH